MDWYLDHMPEDAVAQLLMDLGVGSDPVDDDDWPVFVASEPNKPDNCITVYGTEGINQGRNMHTGEVWEIPGVQFRIRSATPTVGALKAQQLKEAIDAVYQYSVNLDPESGTATNSYLIHDISRKGGVLSLGKESPSSKRNLFTINALVSLRQTT